VPFPARKASPFVACDPAFWRLFQAAGPKLRVLAQDQTEHGNSFHEAGVWSEQTQSLFFTSNRRVDERGEAYTTLSRMDLSKRTRAGSKLLQWQDLDQNEYPFPTPNGGTILPNGNILLCDQGRGDDQLSSLVVVDPTGKRRPRPVLNNHQLLPFNSLNDVVVIPPLCSASNGSHESSYQCSGYKEDEEDDTASLGLSKGYVILFTDPSYGYEQQFKPAPRLPNQVYGFDPNTGEVKVLAEGFDKPNGIVVDEKRKRCYITDTGYIRGDGSTCGTRPGTM
jgi:gluconolactonase